MTTFYKELFSELRSIKTIDLAYKTTNFLEKLLWLLIGTIGAGWFVYFVAFQVIHIRKINKTYLSIVLINSCCICKHKIPFRRFFHGMKAPLY